MEYSGPGCPGSVLVSWVELGRQVVSNKSSSTLLRLLLLYFDYFVLVVLVKMVILGKNFFFLAMIRHNPVIKYHDEKK